MDKEMAEFIRNAKKHDEEHPDRYLNTAITVIEQLDVQLEIRVDQLRRSEECIVLIMHHLLKDQCDPFQALKAWELYRTKIDPRIINDCIERRRRLQEATENAVEDNRTGRTKRRLDENSDRVSVDPEVH